MEEIVLKEEKKIYFASDFHFGAPNAGKSLQRERVICTWLDQIKADAQVLFLMGDIFDFWFEYKHVVPKGYTRFLGKLAELSDSGIKIVVFLGNHDMWMKDYLQSEIKAEVYRTPKEYSIDNKTFFIGHGDGLGPGDYTYKALKVVFESKLCKWLFKNLIHPDLAMWLGYSWAKKSWQQHDKEEGVAQFEAKEKEILYLYCQEQESLKHHDFYVFGHRHLKLDIAINEKSRYINLGDWITFYSYAVFDGKLLSLVDFIER